ncbi:MAG: RpiB/LacA/LacB family sugar-phosphate isomerase [bacterium]|nr:RpiB/LacA/LacB family sugar-phosphate isomerase [bacterium]
MKIYLGTDHAGFLLKEEIKDHLIRGGHEVVDCGALEFDEDDDYPQNIYKVAQAVSHNADARAIIFGGSGQGEAIVANRFKGVRACVYYSENLDIIDASREHNNSNVLSFGARFIGAEHAIEAVDRWLSKPFSREERHQRRIDQIDSLNV